MVHVQYRHAGGEDVVFETETALLRAAGIDVAWITLHNQDIDTRGTLARIKAGCTTVWSRAGKALVADRIRETRADIVHFHNTFPLLSPSVYHACHEAGVPSVQTLHNYRLVCANALLLRAGRACQDCVGGQHFHGLQHRCYRASYAASAAVVAMQYAHRMIGTFRRTVDRYIALTEFARSIFVAGGIPAERISVKPNCLAADPGPGAGAGGYAVYLGRLSEEKGLLAALTAWRALRHVRLKIAGDGPLKPVLEQAIRQHDLPVELVGHLRRDDAIQLLGEACVLIVPSQCYEGFPLTVVEAYARGTPVIASDLGSLHEIVEPGDTGLLVAPGDPQALAAGVERLLADPAALAAMRARCRQVFLARYTGERNGEELLGIYAQAIESRRRPARGRA